MKRKFDSTRLSVPDHPRPYSVVSQYYSDSNLEVATKVPPKWMLLDYQGTSQTIYLCCIQYAVILFEKIAENSYWSIRPKMTRGVFEMLAKTSHLDPWGIPNINWPECPKMTRLYGNIPDPSELKVVLS